MARLVGWVLVTSVCACGGDVAVDVSIDADPCMVDLIERLEARVLDEDGNEVELFERSEGLAFPTGVRVASSDESRGWQVEVVAYAAGDVPIGFQRASGSFEGELSRRGLLLDDRCLGVDCNEGTCIAGECSAATLETVMPNSRPATCPGLAFADAGDGVGMPCGSADMPCARAQNAINTLSETSGIVFLAGGAPHTDTDSVVLDVEIAGLVIRPWPGTGRPIVEGGAETIDVDAADVVIDGLEIRNGTRHGININGADNMRITVRNCEIHGNGDSMAEFDTHGAIGLNNGARDVLIVNNVLRDNTTSLDRRDCGVYANNAPGLVIRSNRIEGNSRNGIFLNSPADVIDNVVVGNGSTGVIHDGEGEVRGNRICANTDRGIIARDEVTIVNNTIVDNTTAAIHFVNATALTVSHNIFAFNGIGLSSDGSADPIDVPNLYFGNDERFDNVMSSMESADVLADPLFIMRDDCSLELMDGSPARGDTPETTFGARP